FLVQRLGGNREVGEVRLDVEVQLAAVLVESAERIPAVQHLDDARLLRPVLVRHPTPEDLVDVHLLTERLVGRPHLIEERIEVRRPLTLLPGPTIHAAKYLRVAEQPESSEEIPAAARRRDERDLPLDVGEDEPKDVL